MRRIPSCQLFPIVVWSVFHPVICQLFAHTAESSSESSLACISVFFFNELVHPDSHFSPITDLLANAATARWYHIFMH